MILDTLANSRRYTTLHPLFTRAFDFLRGTYLLALAPGKHPIQGAQIFAIVEACAGRTRSDAKLECHRRYIDISFRFLNLPYAAVSALDQLSGMVIRE